MSKLSDALVVLSQHLTSKLKFCVRSYQLCLSQLLNFLFIIISFYFIIIFSLQLQQELGDLKHMIFVQESDLDELKSATDAYVEQKKTCEIDLVEVDKEIMNLKETITALEGKLTTWCFYTSHLLIACTSHHASCGNWLFTKHTYVNLYAYCLYLDSMLLKLKCFHL